MTMTPAQNLAISIHAASPYGRDNVKDSDLSRLLEHWPDLRAVFEEVQYLRCRVDDLELMDEMSREA
jgi:hypothetical protein